MKRARWVEMIVRGGEGAAAFSCIGLVEAELEWAYLLLWLNLCDRWSE
jgi:hypothetical protein